MVKLSFLLSPCFLWASHPDTLAFNSIFFPVKVPFVQASTIHFLPLLFYSFMSPLPVKLHSTHIPPNDHYFRSLYPITSGEKVHFLCFFLDLKTKRPFIVCLHSKHELYKKHQVPISLCLSVGTQEIFTPTKAI